MLHPSYSDLMKIVNSEVEVGDTPVVNSRYSIVLATAKRARDLIDGAEAMVVMPSGKKSLSVAVEEMNRGKLTITTDDRNEDEVSDIEEA